MKAAEVQELASAFRDLWEGTVRHVGLSSAWRLLERAYRWQAETEANHGVTVSSTQAVGQMVAQLQQSGASPRALRERDVRCVVCRKTFKAVRASAKHCSNTCKVKARRRRARVA